jgi:hypothetical protein
MLEFVERAVERRRMLAEVDGEPDEPVEFDSNAADAHYAASRRFA